MIFQTVLCAEKVFGPNILLQYLKYRSDVTAETLRRTQAAVQSTATGCKRWGRDGPWGLHKHKQITRDQINTHLKVKPMEQSRYPIYVKMHERCHCSEAGKDYCFSQFWKDRNFPQAMHLLLDRNNLSSNPPPTQEKNSATCRNTSLRLSGTYTKNCPGLSPVGHSLRLSLKRHIQLLMCMTRNKYCFLKWRKAEQEYAGWPVYKVLTIF